MTNELMLAATAFFALGALDYLYGIIKGIYWDVKSALQERRWRKASEARRAEEAANPTVNNAELVSF